MRADYDGRCVAPDGKVDDRVGHVHLVRDRVGLGIELERTSEPSTLSGDDRACCSPASSTSDTSSGSSGTGPIPLHRRGLGQ
jgi:hypothetical protein